MKIAVTGASGFIGRQCLPLLVTRGFEVHSLPFSMDLDEFFAMIQPEYLLHLGWITTPGLYLNSPENHRCLERSRQILHKFKNCGGKKVVVAGTCAEKNPTSLYGSCKKALLDHLQCTDLDWAWGRIFHLFGPYDHPEKIVPFLVRSFLLEKEALCTNRNHVRDYLHVQDVAGVLVELVSSTVKGIFEIGSGNAISMGSLCLKIAEMIGAKEKLQFSSSLESNTLIPDVKRLNTELCWKPSLSLDRGLDETIQWWKNAYYDNHSHLS